MHKTYLFDFDGTLVDSMPCWGEKMLNILRHESIAPKAGLVSHIATLGDKGTAKYFREELGVTLSEEEMFSMMDEYALPRYRDEIPLKEGVEDYLLRMKSMGVSLNILTASPHKMLDPCLKRLGVWDLFGKVWSCDDLGTVKSDPEIYRIAARELGVQTADVAFFDDNLGAVCTAASAGMFTVGVYDASGEPLLSRLQKAADVYIPTFAGLSAV